jgi:hypothetical protein
VVELGVTDTVPEVAPPVENPLPVQDVAFEEDHESADEFPTVILA